MQITSTREFLHNGCKFIGKALKEKINHGKKDKKIEVLRNAYLASSKEDQSLSSEWDSTVGDAL